MILPIVEGHGEVTAVPILIRRIVAQYAPDVYAHVGQAIRVKRTGLIQAGGIERTVELAARQTTPADGILILLDADDDCPREIAEQLLARARAPRPRHLRRGGESRVRGVVPCRCTLVAGQARVGR